MNTVNEFLSCVTLTLPDYSGLNMVNVEVVESRESVQRGERDEIRCVCLSEQIVRSDRLRYCRLGRG